MGAWYLGRWVEGPDVVSPRINDEHPANHNRRKTHHELEADRIAAKIGPSKLIADQRHSWRAAGITKVKPHQTVLGPAPQRLTHELWKLPDGTTGRFAIGVHRTLVKKKGWACIGADGKYDTTPPVSEIEREHLEFELEAQGRDPNEKPRYTGRRFLSEGEVVHERDGTDEPVAGTEHGKTAFDLERAKKP